MTSSPGDFGRYLARLASIESRPFDGTVYRSAKPRYAQRDHLINGEGAKRAGGRWNRRGVAAVYMCLTPRTAMAEALAEVRYFGVPEHSAMPRTFVAVFIKLSLVLDLTQSAVRKQLRISESRMLRADWRRDMRSGKFPITHLLGQAAIDAGFEAVLVHSAQDQGGCNIVIFPDNLSKTSALLVLNAGQINR